MSGWPTVLIGCGNVGSSFAEDPVTARHYRYVSHAQVLHDHPDFDWIAAIDTDQYRATEVSRQWGVPTAAAATQDIDQRELVRVAILATPPGPGRLEALDAFSGLRAVVAEKPLGVTKEETSLFCKYCADRNISVQVNLPRRCDVTHRALAEGGLAEKIGTLHGGALLYGNGLRNNGLHMIDLARALLGDVVTAQAAAAPARTFTSGPIPGDINLSFLLSFANGVVLSGTALPFADYRENAIQLWGSRGGLTLAQEGLRVGHTPTQPHRALHDDQELAQDTTSWETTSIGNAFFSVYDNLADHLRFGTPLLSPPEQACASEEVVDAIVKSASIDGAPVRLG